MRKLLAEYLSGITRKYIKTFFILCKTIIGLAKWNDFFNRWELVRINSRLRLFKTLYLNLRTLPIKQALRIPVLVYGKTSLISLKGKILIPKTNQYGLLQIGITDPVRSLDATNLIQIDGELHIAQGTVFRQGIKLGVLQNSLLKLDENVYIGDNNTIISAKSIVFGKNTRVGNNTTLMDTDFHYMINVKDRTVRNNKVGIEIGEANWIGSWCTIKKGTKTPKYTTVAGPYSMLSKDYTKTINEYCIIGGSPAKILAEGYRRINRINSENEITKHYRASSVLFQLADDIEIKTFCVD
jgi:acetyltransferase-like isoleucine patch superfamily enzyme